MNDYKWVPFFEELSDALVIFENKQKELIGFLLELEYYQDGLNDKDINGTAVPLVEIDPFTFISIIVKFGPEKRNVIFKHLKEKFSLKSDVPESYDGVPSSQPNSSWYFSYKEKRKPGDIPSLWKLFKESLLNKIQEDTFSNALEVRGVGYSSLTQGLFRSRPALYYPIDIQSEPFLEKHGIDYSCNESDKYSDWAKCLAEIKRKFPEKKFYELSYLAWSENKSIKRSKHFWGGGIGDEGDLEKWKKNNFWQINFRKDSNEVAGISAWKSFRKISIGDEFVIRGVGGKNWDDLVCHYYGEVLEKDSKEGILKFKELQKVKYLGKKPKGKGSGNWGVTLNEVNRPEDILLIFGSDGKKHTNDGKELSKGVQEMDYLKNLKLNTVFYGPPGTGKTRMIQQLIDNCFKGKEAVALSEDVIQNLNWWQAIAHILKSENKPMRPIDIYNHQIIQIKSKYTTSKSIKATVCNQLQTHCDPKFEEIKYSNRKEPFIFGYENGKYYLLENWEEIMDLPSLSSAGEDRYEFVTFHQSYSYEEFVDGIRPRLSVDEGAAEIGYERAAGKFLNICKKAEENKDKKYAMFIDELNRGNVSQIFGELITLIEDSKRLVDSVGTKVTLTYSKDTKFGVPDNLYIIGTMNTADKSVAPLDFALRRRFHFQEFWPKSSVIVDNWSHEEQIEVSKNEMKVIFESINEKIEILKGRDYTLGHSYFLGIESRRQLHEVMYQQIIPLLSEYFHDDYDALNFVLGNKFVSKEDNTVIYNNLPNGYNHTFKLIRFDGDNEQEELGRFITAFKSISTNGKKKKPDASKEEES